MLNAMADMAADEGLLHSTLNIMRVAQMIVQAIMPNDSELIQLPGIDRQAAATLQQRGVRSLAQFMRNGSKEAEKLLTGLDSRFSSTRITKAVNALQQLPIISMHARIERNSLHGSEGSEKLTRVIADADCTLLVDLKYEAVAGRSVSGSSSQKNNRGE